MCSTTTKCEAPQFRQGIHCRLWVTKEPSFVPFFAHESHFCELIVVVTCRRSAHSSVVFWYWTICVLLLSLSAFTRGSHRKITQSQAINGCHSYEDSSLITFNHWISAVTLSVYCHDGQQLFCVFFVLTGIILRLWFIDSRVWIYRRCHRLTLISCYYRISSGLFKLLAAHFKFPSRFSSHINRQKKVTRKYSMRSRLRIAEWAKSFAFCLCMHSYPCTVCERL